MMTDQSPSKLSPTAKAFKPGAKGARSDGRMKGVTTNERRGLSFPRTPEFLVQKEEVTKARSNYGDQKLKNKTRRTNKPQHRNHPDLPRQSSHGEQAFRCQSRRKAMNSGNKYVCVDCGAFSTMMTS